MAHHLEEADGQVVFHMKQFAFTFSDWENNYWTANSPPSSLLDRLPTPTKMTNYSPAWGKFSESGRKAAATRNFKRHEKNKELFWREVLPKVRHMLDADSLHDIGLVFIDAPLLHAGGRNLWRKGAASQWIKEGHPDEQAAIAIGAEKLTMDAAVAFLKS